MGKNYRVIQRFCTPVFDPVIHDSGRTRMSLQSARCKWRRGVYWYWHSVLNEPFVCQFGCTSMESNRFLVLCARHTLMNCTARLPLRGISRAFDDDAGGMWKQL
jgi:hypothetical protein